LIDILSQFPRDTDIAIITAIGMIRPTEDDYGGAIVVRAPMPDHDDDNEVMLFTERAARLAVAHNVPDVRYFR
jgi:hypothetical protein